MKVVRTSRSGIEYLTSVLHETIKTVTKAVIWKIPHNDPDKEDYSVKIGRYKKPKTPFGDLEVVELEPKSELTLKYDEFKALLKFIESEYKPVTQGVKKFIPIETELTDQVVDALDKLFSNPKIDELATIINSRSIIKPDLLNALNNLDKINSVQEFEKMLQDDLSESIWQKWFEKNDWVLGTEFVRIIDERRIDSANIGDFLMQAYDGFLDVVEIKRPSISLQFWSKTTDHNNIVPHQDLIKAITQTVKYVLEIEREANSLKFIQRVDEVKTVKPRAFLIYGRSNEWGEKEKEAFRILNSSYRNITIMTYDHVLLRAKKIISN